MSVRPFEREDQERVRTLILEGMRDRWGDGYDESRNPDVDDVMKTYVQERGADVTVIEANGEVVAVGMLVPAGDETGQLVRMAVDRAHRGQGYGKTLVRHLVATAKRQRMQKVVVKTDTPWKDAVGLYTSCGFRKVDEAEGETHFEVNL